jgi:IS1 family transposase
MDEVVISIAGRRHWLWRAIDQDGFVLNEIVQSRRNTKVARRLLIRLLKQQGLTPKCIITDKLRSYGAAKQQIMPAIEHRSHKGLNNRAGNSHVPLRKQERVMQGFDRWMACSAWSRSSPPDLDYVSDGEFIRSVIRMLEMSLLGGFFGVVFSIPLAGLAARNITLRRSSSMRSCRRCASPLRVLRSTPGTLPSARRPSFASSVAVASAGT